MNTALTALVARVGQSGLESYGLPAAVSCVLLTPRFRASRHVVFLIFPHGAADPTLVAKVPRLAGDTSGVDRERAVLTAAQDAREGGYATIPRVVAYEEVSGLSILVESALVGLPLTPERVRRDSSGAIAAVLAWLEELPFSEPSVDPERFVRLIEDPLNRFSSALGRDARELVGRTLELLEPLREVPLATVVEHGDLSHPNLLSLRSGEIGVVDWELGHSEGFPTHDLFFFVNFVSAALARASTPDQQVRALHDALIRPTGWARDIVSAYALRTGIEHRYLAPLLVACFSRYTAGVFGRLHGTAGIDAPPNDYPSGYNDPSREELVRMIRADRHYALWQHVVAYADELA
jgi:Phosphotransferase enzyme family